MGRWRTYSEEEKQARRLTDKKLRENADALLDDPEQVAAMFRVFAALPEGSRVRSYSERNQALLFGQAEERGIALVDVDTFRGWRVRGRKVKKGARGLRIVAPKGHEQQSEQADRPDTAPITAPSTEPAPNGKDDGESLRFRMVSVFDVSQTEEAVTEADRVPADQQQARPA